MLVVCRKRRLFGAAAMVLADGEAQAQPTWREAFQSSPATYEAPSEAFIQFANGHSPDHTQLLGRGCSVTVLTTVTARRFAVS